MKLNEKQQQIISTNGNILVIANPGTGKTTLLGFKFIDLLKKGFEPGEILCLTFTNKAQKELEEKIIKLIEVENLKIKLSDLQIYTFHSYASKFLKSSDVISTNLLRYKIFKYLKQNEIFGYNEKYLINDVVPMLENYISYMKSFGIHPAEIDIKNISAKLLEKSKNTIDEKTQNKKNLIDKDLNEKYIIASGFVENFLKIFKFYEDEKTGADYSDLLIKFYEELKKQKSKPFKFVLVDELQDVNKMEAEISLLSGENFVAVGDKKQAIFGFQGGSITNFEKFNNSTQFILSDNYRSTNEILDYSSEYFISNTKDLNHEEELKNLKNPSTEIEPGVKPEIIKIGKDKITKNDNTFEILFSLLKKTMVEGKKTAIIARTNSQLEKISKELSKNGLTHTTTSFGDSSDAKKQVTNFLISLFSDDLVFVKNSVFNLYSPLNLQKAFEISNKKFDSLAQFLIAVPELKNLRDKISNIEDLNQVFLNTILPVAISTGENHYFAAKSVHDAFLEALDVLNELNFKNIIDFIETSSVDFEETEIESDLILTTVHKSKGKQYDFVIFIPSKTLRSSKFSEIDLIIEEILIAKNLNVKEELEEEILRINFVAFTRAKSKLYILTEKVEDFLNDSSELSDVKITENLTSDLKSKALREYNLFLTKNFIDSNYSKEWIIDYVKNYFANLSSLSYSRVTSNAYEYLKNNILRISEPNEALELGLRVHEFAKKLFDGESFETKEKNLVIIKKNILQILKEVNETYLENYESELPFGIDLTQISATNERIKFSGKIDAIFKNGDEYLILDWKTDKNSDRASEHRRQLEVYRKAFAVAENIPIEKIKIGIAFVAMRDPLKHTAGESIKLPMLDLNQPKKIAFETFEKHLSVILNWKKDFNLFFEDLKKTKIEEVFLKNILDEINKAANL